MEKAAIFLKWSHSSLKLKKITKEIGLKHFYLQASSLDGLFCAEHFAT